MTYRVAIGPSSFAQEDDTPIRLLESAGVEIVPNPYSRRLTEEEIIAHLVGVDGLVAGLEPLNRKVLSSAPQLKVIARVGIGVTNVDFEAAREFNVKVSNTPDPPAIAVAELTLTALLVLCRKLIPTNSALHAGEWKKMIGLGLLGTKVLLVGYGRIGRRVGHLLRAFGAEVLVADPFVEQVSLKDGERLVKLEEGLGEAQAISLHASGTDTLIGPEQFDRMRDGVILLNSARGELVDEDALVTALESGKVGGAWFDAFWQEPYKGQIVGFEQALLTPHVGTYTQQCRLDMESEAVRNLLRDLELENKAS
jgi:D-3-phosphoglycerate dehydrogenase